MNELDWIKEFPAAVTVCDENGIILDMNDKAAQGYEKDGGRALIGTQHASTATRSLPAARPKRCWPGGEKNVYTIEKNGVRKLIYQSPWYHRGQYAGFVELSLEIPWEMPHFIRS